MYNKVVAYHVRHPEELLHPLCAWSTMNHTEADDCEEGCEAVTYTGKIYALNVLSFENAFKLYVLHEIM